MTQYSAAAFNHLMLQSIDEMSTNQSVHSGSIVSTSDVTIYDTIVYPDTLGHGMIHDTLSSRYIGKLSLTYENSYRIVKLSAETPN